MWRLLLFLFTIYTSTVAQMVLFQEPSKRGEKYCGEKLADVLHLVCKGVYNSAFKKSMISSKYENAYPLLDGDYEPRFPFKSKDSALTMFPSSRLRVSRGVYDECCRKTCSYHEIRSYCGDK